MDGLSAAGSVISIVSVAIQLADSARKLCDFISDIKDAPAELEHLGAVSRIYKKQGIICVAYINLGAQATTTDSRFLGPNGGPEQSGHCFAPLRRY